MAQASTSGARSEQFLRNVFLLKNGDFEVINGQIHMPTMGQMATIRIRTDQYKRGLEFNTSMSSDMVKEKLEKTFPYLKDKGFSCAAKRNVDKDTAQFDFDRSSCPWNGETIKKKLQGNSTLYILEDDQMDTSSGISASDSESSQGLDNYLNCDVEDVTGMLQDNFDFVVECNPAYSPVQGGGPCVFTFVPELPSKVTSVYATFEGLGTQKLEFLKLGFFPASRDPQVITVRLTSQDGSILGYTRVTYVLTKEQQVVSFPSYMREFFEDLESGNPCGNSSGNSGGETESLRTLGCKKPAQLLSLLVYVAAEIGAQQFIEIIFTSSARRVVHNAYKRNLTLPETVARDHGYIETANYLADVTKRFSEETSTDNEFSQTIDWSELVRAADAAEKQLDLTNEKQNGQVETNDPKEIGYLADADTSSSAPQSSDSEDDISNKTKTTATATAAAAAAATTTATATRKGSVSLGLQKYLHREDLNAATGDLIAGNYRGRQETLHQHALHSTTSTFSATSARLEIFQQCRHFADLQFNQSYEWPRVFKALVVHFVVAVVDKDTGEIWPCNMTPEVHQIYVTRDRMFRIVPEVKPYAWMSACDVDCRNKSVPPYACNLEFLIPFKRGKPFRSVVRIKLCQRVADYNLEVLDAVQFIFGTHEWGSHDCDFQVGRTVPEIEGPIPRTQMQGVLAKKMGRIMRRHFVNLGDNGQHDPFLRDKQKFYERVDGIVRFQDLLLAVGLEEATLCYIQNRKEDCLAKCRVVCERATHLNSGKWPVLLARAFYIISAVYGQTKEFDLANEYMEKSSECLAPAFLSEENAMNRYNTAALLAEKSAAVVLTADEEQKAERLYEEVAKICLQQKEKDSMRCVTRGYNRMIMYFLKSSRARFPDLREEVSEVNIAKAGIAIQKVEKNLLAQCPKRLKATFLIGKADYFIRRATRRGLGVSEVERNLDFQRAKDELAKAMQISRVLMMQTEIEGIEDRTRTIQKLIALVYDGLMNHLPPSLEEGNESGEENTNDPEDLFQNLLISEEEKNRRREDQCTD